MKIGVITVYPIDFPMGRFTGFGRITNTPGVEVVLSVVSLNETLITGYTNDQMEKLRRSSYQQAIDQIVQEMESFDHLAVYLTIAGSEPIFSLLKDVPRLSTRVAFFTTCLAEQVSREMIAQIGFSNSPLLFTDDAGSGVAIGHFIKRVLENGKWLDNLRMLPTIVTDRSHLTA